MAQAACSSQDVKLCAMRVMLLAASSCRRCCVAQTAGAELPRFRAGANLVRVEPTSRTTATRSPISRPKTSRSSKTTSRRRIENFELITARAPNPQSERTNPTNVRDMRQQAPDAARVFTLFFDRFYVSAVGLVSRAQADHRNARRVIGPDDLVGVMTPEMSPSAITYSRRTTSIERAVTDTWYWGKRDSIIAETPQEQAIRDCYPDGDDTRSRRQDDRAAARAADARCARRRWSRISRRCVPSASS